MYFVLGLLSAGLVALALSPAVWRRAHRLAKARVESSLPMSMGEVQAEKDQLRASFAISARRLEMQVDGLRRTATEQTLATGRLKAQIAALSAELDDRKAAVGALEARLVEAGDALKAAEAGIEAARSEIASRDASLTELAERIVELKAGLANERLLTEEQRLELVARDTAIGNLEDQLAASRAGEAQVAAALAAEQAAHAAERVRSHGLEAQIAALGVERADRIASLGRRAAEISAVEAQLAAARAERDELAATVAVLEAERSQRANVISGGTEEIVRLRTGATASDEAAPVAANDGGDNMRKAIEAMEAEKATLEARLASVEADHAAVLAENSALRQAAGVGNQADEAIRQRLAEIAANVLSLTRAPELGEAGRRADKGNGGNGTPHLHAVPAAAQPTAHPATTELAVTEPQQAPVPRTLADRIRALQQVARH